MSAATENRSYTGEGSDLAFKDIAQEWNGPIAANTVLYVGTLAGVLNSDTSTNFPGLKNFVGDGTMTIRGFVTAGADNTGGAKNARPCRVRAMTGALVDLNAGGGSAITIADLWKPIYGVNNQACSKLVADGVCIGCLVGIDPASGNPVVLASPLVVKLFALMASTGSVYTQTYSTADRTVANPTDAALTDSSTGSAGATIAAGVGVNTLTFPITLASITGNADVLTAYVPGYKFKILSISFATGQPATTAAKATTLTPFITGVSTTGGATALTSANCTPLGALVAGSAITGANTGAATDSISIRSTATTAFVEGNGYLLLKIQNMDTADAFASIEAKHVLGIADDLDNRKTLTAIIDDLQTVGAVG